MFQAKADKEEFDIVPYITLCVLDDICGNYNYFPCFCFYNQPHYSSFKWFATTWPKMPDSNNCFWHLNAVANFTTRHGFCSILGKILHFVSTQFGVLRIRIWRIFICDVSKFAAALKCQKQLLTSSILNLGGRESLEIAVIIFTLIFLILLYIMLTMWFWLNNIYS